MMTDTEYLDGLKQLLALKIRLRDLNDHAAVALYKAHRKVMNAARKERDAASQAQGNQ